ncbi:hypothetical protein JTE90_003597 [Oedothorax gibbosus]|uniref:Histone deacetylase complex subunit SAP30 Sin3 binding domain-containing protein n=1 Tax=Oedothorax gibbosus TaxID=931172 RepID=A0AAV6TJ34_9ARAC|nr:hypothetical protein JTE90_003597 [Oedothorax gibbosus]
MTRLLPLETCCGNRYGPPPEFPLASFLSGLVTIFRVPPCGLKLRHFTVGTRRGLRCAPLCRAPRKRDGIPNACDLPACTSFRTAGLYSTLDSRTVRLLGPCFKTGRGDRIGENLAAMARTHFGQQPRSGDLAAECVSGTLTPNATIPHALAAGFGGWASPGSLSLLR